LHPVIWPDKYDPQVGTLLAAIGPNGKPLAAGIVSVGRRDLPARTCKDKLPLRVPVTDLEVMLWLKSGGEQVIDYVGVSCGLALAAGIHRGDLIQSLGGQNVRTMDDFKKSLQGHLSGDIVNVGLLHDGKQVELKLPLSAGLYPGISFRSDGFPTVFEHGIPVMANECGGPLVDLSGRVVGITIARVGHGCMAVPGDCIERLLPELHSGRLAKNWKWPRNDDK
jgi:serine protease Do